MQRDFIIAGLEWRSNWKIANGKDSFVVPFPTLRPVTIVFHGEDKFDYGHYGIHLGQADVLTFLGPSDREITGLFIDCRAESPTARKREVRTWKPTSGEALYIPPGVAHAFEDLEGVHTLNTYELFLPEPEKWVNDDVEWRIEADVINLPMNIKDADIPIFSQNRLRASDVWYQLVAEQQRKAIPELDHEYPVTQDVRLNDGEKVRVELRKKRDMITTKQWEPIEGIEGVGWVANAVLWSGANSGFVPLLDPRPLYFIDHGEHDYTHDASGIHLGQEDRLTFVGPSDHEVTLVLLDTRQGSPTLHNEVLTTFTPSALRHLKIPNGVAHRFEHLECVFTFNRPHVYLPEQGDYEPGNDVIDWPIGKLPPPVLEVYRQPAPLEFYQRQVAAQRELMLEPAMHATPTVIMTESADGGIVRVAFRKPSATAASTA